MGEDGSVVIGVDMNISDAEKELTKLRKKVFDLEDKINKADFKKSGLVEQSKQMAVNLDAAKAKLEKMKSAAAGMYSKEEIKEQADIVKGLQSEWNKIENEIDRCNKTIRDTNAEIAYTKQRFVDVGQQASKLGSGGLMSATFQRLTDLLRQIPSLAKSAFGAFSKAVLSASKSVLSAVKNLNVFSKLTKKIGPSVSRLGKMIRRVFVFSVITSGLRMLRTQLTSYLGTNTELMTALGSLKGVFLTAFQPIYKAILPALTALINTMTHGVAVAAQFIATLFGTTAKQAQANAKALNKQAKATESAGGAAKDAQKYLSRFDEIQQIGGSSKRSVNTEAGAPSFDYEFDNSAFESWGEAFSYVLDNVLSGIDRLKIAFSDFSTWLNGISFNLLEMFQFPGVEEKVVAIGTELASAFNSLASSVNWEQFGQAIGSGLSLALSGLVSFISTFDWQRLGKNLAECFNGLASQINWTEFGELLWSSFKIGIETLTGFLTNVNMPELAKAASNMIIDFFNSAVETIRSIKWGKIGAQITAFIAEFDWAGVAQSASNLVKDFFNSLTEFITNVDWYLFGEKIKEFLVNIDWSGIVTSLFTTIGAAYGAAASFLWGLIEDAWNAVVGWWRENIEGKSAGEIIDGLLNGLKNAIVGIGTWIKNNIFVPFIEGFKAAFKISSPSKVMEDQGNYIMEGLINGLKDGLKPLKDFWNSVVSVVESAVNFMIDGINAAISALNKLSFEVPDWVPVIGGETFGFNISKVSKISIPRLAQGAVIPPNREFMAVLGDQKQGTNIEAPAALIKQMVMEALRESGAFNSNNQGEAVMVVDSEVFGRLSYKLGNRESKRIGASLVEG